MLMLMLMLTLNHRSQGWSPETGARGGLMARRSAARAVVL
jgi:hypothetical protein